MVQKVPFTSTSGNTMTIGTGTSRVIMGADSGNLKIQDSQSNTSIIEAGAGIVGASAISVVANPAALPFNPISSAGSLAFTTSTNSLYISNGSGWYKISMVNTSPTITLSSTTAEPTGDNLTLDFTYTVTEPEGTPTTVTFANSGIATTGNVAITHTTSNNHVRLVFDGDTEYAGDATVTLSATDGVNTGTGTITISTAYALKNSKYEALTLLATNPPGITTAKQQSFSFDGTGDYVTASSVDTAGTGEFTAEAFFYANSLPSVGCIMAQRATTPSTGNYAQWLVYVQSNGNLAWYNGVSGQRVVETGAGGVVANRWYHVAITRDSSNVMTMWKDGESVGTRNSQTQNWNYAPFSIGANGNGTEAFNGYISNVRWIVGTALYSSNFTVPTSPLTAVTNTKLLTLQGSTTDYSGENETVTASGDAAYNTKSPFEPAGTLYTNKYVRDTSDSAHTMEMRGTNAQSHTTTVSPYSSGGYSAFFDGNGDYLTISDSADFNFATGNGDFTIESWIYKKNASESGWYTQRDTSTTELMVFLDHNISGYSAGSVSIEYDSAQYTFDAGIRQNVWQHIALVRTGTTVKWFTDGVERDSRTEPASLADYAHEIYIGTWRSLSRYFQGYISDLRIVNGTAVYTSTFTPPRSRLTAITNTKLLACHLPYFKDGSSDNYTLTINGNTYLESFSPYNREIYNPTKHGGSFYIDNTDSGNLETTDKASNEIQLGSGDFTVELWYRPKDVSSSWEAIISKSYLSSGGWRLYKNNGDASLKWYYGSILVATTTSAVLKNDTWTHIAVVRDNTTLKIYADGVEAVSQSDTYNYTTSSAGEIEIGSGRSGSTWTGEGWISDVRIVVGTPVYTGAFTPPTRPLTKTGGTYPSTTNVNTSITSAHTKLLLNLNDVLVGDATQFQSLEMVGNVISSLEKSKFTDKPSIYFDGNGDYLSQNIQAPDDADIMKIGTQDFTVEGYVYALSITADSQYRRIFAYGDNGTDSIQVYINPSSGAFVYTSDDSSVKITGTSNIQNTWKHFAVTRSGNIVYLHVDGTIEGSTVIDSGNKTQAAGQFLIGKYPGFSGHFHGYLDNLRVSNGLARYPFVPEFIQLTTTNSANPATTVTSSNVRVVGVYNSSSASTMSGTAASDITVSLGSGTSVSTFAPYTGGGSIYMDGGAGPTTYASFTTSSQDGLFTFASSDDFGIEYYIYHNEVVASGTSHRHINTNVTGGLGFFKAGSGDPGGSNRFTIRRKGSGNDLSIPNYNDLFPPFKWHHVCVQRVSGTLTVFINGKPAGSATGNTRAYPNGVVGFGSVNTVSDNFNGYFSNLRVVKGQGIYSSSFTPPERFK